MHFGHTGVRVQNMSHHVLYALSIKPNHLDLSPSRKVRGAFLEGKRWSGLIDKHSYNTHPHKLVMWPRITAWTFQVTLEEGKRNHFLLYRRTITSSQKAGKDYIYLRFSSLQCILVVFVAVTFCLFALWHFKVKVLYLKDLTEEAGRKMVNRVAEQIRRVYHS